MNFNTFRYLFKEGWKNVFKNKKTTIASLIITCFTMIICGIFFVAMGNVEKTSDKIVSQQGMEAFLYDLNEEETKRVEEQIKNIEGIREITYKNKNQALAEAKEDFKENPPILAGLEGFNEDNTLPASFVIMLSDLEKSNKIKSQISQIEGIEDVVSKDEVIKKTLDISKIVKVVTIAILISSVVGSIAIISNTIKISVYSRRKEISIMKYVGATDNFIRVPFLVQGALTGLFSAVISTIIVAVVYKLSITAFQDIIRDISLTIISFNDMLKTLILMFLGIGIGVGMAGSYISMKKYLKV